MAYTTNECTSVKDVLHNIVNASRKEGFRVRYRQRRQSERIARIRCSGARTTAGSTDPSTKPSKDDTDESPHCKRAGGICSSGGGYPTKGEYVEPNAADTAKMVRLSHSYNSSDRRNKERLELLNM